MGFPASQGGTLTLSADEKDYHTATPWNRTGRFLSKCRWTPSGVFPAAENAGHSPWGPLRSCRFCHDPIDSRRDQ